MVIKSNALIEPLAVVVHSEHAFVAFATMMASRWLWGGAYLAVAEQDGPAEIRAVDQQYVFDVGARIID
jgi:hypothetical protein